MKTIIRPYIEEKKEYPAYKTTALVMLSKTFYAMGPQSRQEMPDELGAMQMDGGKRKGTSESRMYGLIRAAAFSLRKHAGYPEQGSSRRGMSCMNRTANRHWNSTKDTSVSTRGIFPPRDCCSR